MTNCGIPKSRLKRIQAFKRRLPRLIAERNARMELQNSPEYQRAMELLGSELRPTEIKKGELRLVPYLPDLYRRLCDPRFATEYIVAVAESGDETALRISVADLITALCIHFEVRRLRSSPQLPDWDSRAKHFKWSTCPAVEKSKPKNKYDGRTWVFAGSRMPLRVLFESLFDGQTVDEFAAEHAIGAEQLHAVIEFARKCDKQNDQRKKA
jgi:uncharacterized protein (DUF433 family)